MKKTLSALISIGIIIFIVQLVRQHQILDKKSIVANTLMQYISQKENTICRKAEYSDDDKDGKYKIKCENGTKEINII